MPDTHHTKKTRGNEEILLQNIVGGKNPDLPLNKGNLLVTMCVARDLVFPPKRVKSDRHIQALRVLRAYCISETSTEPGVKCGTIKKGLNGRGWLRDGKAGEKAGKLAKTLNF